MADKLPNQPLPLLPHEEPLPPRLDLWIALVFMALGIGILSIAAGMPTYREQLGDAYTAPGLVPAVHGAIVILLSLWLGIRAIRRGAFAAATNAGVEKPVGYSNTRLALAAGLCLVFAAGLIGRMPFGVAAAVFVSGFILLFEWRSGMATGEHLKRAATAIAIGIATGIAVTLVFERLFLVRLP
jgi:hypothetical protein